MRLRMAVWVLALATASTATVVESRRASGPGPEQAEPFHAALVMDAATGEVLFEKDAHRQLPPASMTKMMLMLLVAERVRDGQLKWDDPIRASRRASKMGGSQVYLREGEVFTLAEMMQAIIIHSANDASMAVAEALAGSGEAFVDLMNLRAREFNLNDTAYQSPHGLPPGPGQKPDLTSAHDLAALARELMKHSKIMEWADTVEAPFRNGQFKLVNTNHLVRNLPWIDGLKTGYYREAGFGVVATGQRDGLHLIAVVLGSPRKAQCFDEAAKLLHKGFAGYKAVFPVRKGDVVASDVPVRSGKPRFVRVIAADDVKVLAPRAEQRSLSTELRLLGEPEAPLAARARLGEVIVKDGEREVGRVPALAADAVERQTSFWERWF